MEEDAEKLSEGAQMVMSIIKSEPVPPKFKTIDPKLAEEVIKMLNEAMMFTDKNMPWLNGVYIDFSTLHEIHFTIEKIRRALEKGAEFEGDFWDGVKQSQDARNGFIEALFKASENGSISFNQKKSEG